MLVVAYPRSASWSSLWDICLKFACLGHWRLLTYSLEMETSPARGSTLTLLLQAPTLITSAYELLVIIRVLESPQTPTLELHVSDDP